MWDLNSIKYYIGQWVFEIVDKINNELDHLLLHTSSPLTPGPYSRSIYDFSIDNSYLRLPVQKCQLSFSFKFLFEAKISRILKE